MQPNQVAVLVQPDRLLQSGDNMQQHCLAPPNSSLLLGRNRRYVAYEDRDSEQSRYSQSSQLARRHHVVQILLLMTHIYPSSRYKQSCHCIGLTTNLRKSLNEQIIASRVINPKRRRRASRPGHFTLKETLLRIPYDVQWAPETAR